MADIIFKNTEELTSVSEVNISVNFNSLINSLDRATRYYLIPAIGKDMYTALLSSYNSSSAAGKMLEALTWAQKAIAPLALFLFIPRTEAAITDAGLRRGGTNESPGAFRYQVKEAKGSYLDDGLDALENLCRFLEEEVNIFSEWKDSEVRKKYSKALIRSGLEFTNYFKLRHPQLDYQALYESMAMVEDLIMVKKFGNTYKSLKEKQNKSETSPTENELLDLLKKALVNLTFYKGIPKLSVRVDDNGLTIMSNSSDISAGEENKRTAAEIERLKILSEDCRSTGDAYLQEAENFLNNESTESVFSEWFASNSNKNQSGVDLNKINQAGSGLFSM